MTTPTKTRYGIVWVDQLTEAQGDVITATCDEFEDIDMAEAIMEQMQERQLHLDFEVVEVNYG